MENYKTCEKCGIVRNLDLAPNCPICSSNIISKYRDTPARKKYYEEIGRLSATRDYLSKEIKQNWKIIKTFDKDEALKVYHDLEILCRRAKKLLSLKQSL